ncbi:MAG: hypothetical protein ACHQC8_04140 [Solirubrobacterales bacterium]
MRGTLRLQFLNTGLYGLGLDSGLQTPHLRGYGAIQVGQLFG